MIQQRPKSFVASCGWPYRQSCWESQSFSWWWSCLLFWRWMKTRSLSTKKYYLYGSLACRQAAGICRLSVKSWFGSSSSVVDELIVWFLILPSYYYYCIHYYIYHYLHIYSRFSYYYYNDNNNRKNFCLKQQPPRTRKHNISKHASHQENAAYTTSQQTLLVVRLTDVFPWLLALLAVLVFLLVRLSGSSLLFEPATPPALGSFGPKQERLHTG